MKSPPARLQNRPRSKDLLLFERRLLAQGIVRIAGVDEAGRGCLAGPVTAAAVILPERLHLPGVNDSKLLSPKKREELFEKICDVALAWGVAEVEAQEIDRINIHRASLKAMQMAVSKLLPEPEFILVDGRFPIPLSIPQKAIIRGDRKSQSVAAASILAKVSRDRWISQESEKYPEFNFKIHKGYGTAEHFRELERHGPSPLHRRSFLPLKEHP